MKGWLYEERGHEFFLDKFGFLRYFPGQWFQYGLENGQIKFCQTDGLLFTPEQQKVLILEFKFKHTQEAYKQIEFRYVPVVKRIFRGWTICCCEVVRWYDPSTNFPVRVSLTDDIESLKPNEFGVYINSFS